MKSHDVTVHDGDGNRTAVTITDIRTAFGQEAHADRILEAIQDAFGGDDLDIVVHTVQG